MTAKLTLSIEPSPTNNPSSGWELWAYNGNSHGRRIGIYATQAEATHKLKFLVSHEVGHLFNPRQCVQGTLKVTISLDGNDFLRATDGEVE